jgi:hypothetical protein
MALRTWILPLPHAGTLGHAKQLPDYRDAGGFQLKLLIACMLAGGKLTIGIPLLTDACVDFHSLLG